MGGLSLLDKSMTTENFEVKNKINYVTILYSAQPKANDYPLEKGKVTCIYFGR